MTTVGANAAFSVAANLLGIRLDPYMGYNFLVEFEGLIAGGFNEVTGLQVETVVETYREGGLNEYEHKLAGPTHYPSNLILKHGLTDIETLWLWHQDVVRGKFKRKNGTIYLMDQLGLPAMWWDVKEAYPVKWAGPELRATNSVVAVETLELVHRGIVKPAASSTVAALRLAASMAGSVG
jgi:phage tail-like protein